MDVCYTFCGNEHWGIDMELSDTTNRYLIKSLDALDTIYGEPLNVAVIKEKDYISGPGRSFIEKSPFVVIATAGKQGVDCSPKGDHPGFVRVEDEKTLLIPDRKGNNRVDGMRNIISNPSIGLLFLIPGVDMTYRVTGSAVISVEPELLESFSVNQKVPSSVMVIKVRTAFQHCTKALIRAQLWNEGAKGVPEDAPTMATFAASLSGAKDFNTEKYDADYQARIEKTLY